MAVHYHTTNSSTSTSKEKEGLSMKTLQASTSEVLNNIEKWVKNNTQMIQKQYVRVKGILFIAPW